MRRRKSAGHENHERWMVSYADFVTLLFAFFVVMFASSQTDKAKAQRVADSVRHALEKGGFAAAVKEVLGGTVDHKGKGNTQMKGPGGAQRASHEAPPTEAELLPALSCLNKELAEEIRDGQIRLSLQPRGLVVTLAQAAFFPSGEDAIDPATYRTLSKIAEVMRALPNPVRLEGHTDAVPIHTARFHSNWELSAARGIAMLDLLSDRFGVPRGHIAIAGYADTVPVADNDTEDGRRRNRRVDIVLLSQHSLMNEPAEAQAPSLAPSEKSASR